MRSKRAKLYELFKRVEYTRAHELAERQRERQIARETEIAWRQYEATEQKQETAK